MTIQQGKIFQLGICQARSESAMWTQVHEGTQSSPVLQPPQDWLLREQETIFHSCVFCLVLTAGSTLRRRRCSVYSSKHANMVLGAAAISPPAFWELLTS